MSSSQAVQPKDELQDSWVELYYQNGRHGNVQNGNGSSSQDPDSTHVFYPANIEKLLIEAQKESRTPSGNNSREASVRGSPKSPHSPTNELATNSQDEREPGTDWIWDWSSRPEMMPPRTKEKYGIPVWDTMSEYLSEFNGKFKHPVRKHKLSVRNTPVMRSALFRVFQLENLPILLLTHACAVFLGAAGLFMYLKKFHWTKVAILSTSIE